MVERAEILLKEYEQVYAEVRRAITLQFSALGVGIAVIGVLFHGIIKQIEVDNSEWLFLMSSIVPIIVALTLLIWIGEVARMRRGSVYLSYIETTLETLVPSKNETERFGFHNWLLHNSKNPQLRANYISVILLFFLIGDIAFYICLRSLINLA